MPQGQEQKSPGKDLDMTFYDSVHISLFRLHESMLVSKDKRILSDCGDAVDLDGALKAIGLIRF